jgi:Glycosyltransferase
MRILHIGKYYPPHFGGIEKVNFDLVEELNKHHYSTDVLCFNDAHINSFEENKYRIYRASTLIKLNSTPASLELRRILKKIHNNYDIIHLHLPNPMAALAFQSVQFKGKLVIHWHSDIIKQVYLKKIYGPFQKALLKRADRIIVTSPPYLEGSKELADFKLKCTVIPIGIEDHEEVNEDLLQSLKDTYQDKKVIFSLGRLIYYKGFEYLIDAAKELPDNYQILIGGEGDLYQQLNQQIKQNKLEYKVQLVGKIPSKEISAYFALCDLYCMPSCERSEAFGIVQIEAMSYGKPVVSTSIPYSGVAWINEHETTGRVVRPKDPIALADAIKTILEDQETKTRLCENARKKFLKEFTLEKMFQRTVELYKTLIKE